MNDKGGGGAYMISLGHKVFRQYRNMALRTRAAIAEDILYSNHLCVSIQMDCTTAFTALPQPHNMPA